MAKRRCDRRGLRLSDACQANAKVVGAMAKRKGQKNGQRAQANADRRANQLIANDGPVAQVIRFKLTQYASTVAYF